MCGYQLIMVEATDQVTSNIEEFAGATCSVFKRHAAHCVETNKPKAQNVEVWNHSFTISVFFTFILISLPSQVRR